MSEEQEQLHVKVDKRTKERAKSNLPHGGLSDIVRDAIRRAADGNAERYRLREELTALRDDREELKQERAALDRQISNVDRKIERIEEKLEKYTDPEDEYKGYLKSLLEDMRENGMHVDPGHGKIKEASNMVGKEPEQVIEDMKEMGEDIPDRQFQQKSFGGL